MASHRSRQFPPELLQLISQSFNPSEDTHDLDSLTRVSRQWLPIARNRLFETLHIRQWRIRNRGRDVVLEWGHFVKQFPELLGHVRRLHVKGLIRSTPLSFATLSQAMAHCPRLTEVQLSNWSVDWPSLDVALEQSSTSLRAVRTLELSWFAQLGHPSRFFDILRFFPGVRHLAMAGTRFDYTYGGWRHIVAGNTTLINSINLPAELSLASLAVEIADASTEFLLEALSKTRTPETIKSLSLTFEEFAALVPGLSRFFDHQLAALEHVAFNFVELFPELSDVPAMARAEADIQRNLKPALAKCKGVRSFTLYLPDTASRHTAFWSRCVVLLSALPEGMQRITVHATKDSFYMNLPALKSGMGRYQDLEYLKFVVERTEFLEQTRERLKDEMPEVNEREVLRVVERDSEA